MSEVDILVEEARTKRTPPPISKERGQRSLTFDNPFFFRYMPQFRSPDWLGAEQWRAFVQSQTVAVSCRETIQNYILSLDWKISPRDSTKLDELKSVIEYNTRFLTYTGEYDFEDIIEWIIKDYLDLPFGAAAEVGRAGDKPYGKLEWIKLLDGGTLFPTRNTTYPVGQAMPSDTQKPVYFPAHAINRLYMSPRTEFMRQGWGMAPPEKIYMAMEMISKGDKYYVNFLNDTPEAGLLDLLDMDKESAENWIEAFRAYMQGTDPFKIPVLYQHENYAKFIPFGRPPTEIMFGDTYVKYAALTCAGYGLTLSDIGFASSSNGGDTLAGSIRQERRSKRQGIAKAKKRIAAWMNRLIDPSQKLIKFEWVDLDDEFAIAQGRARLATATAVQQLIDSGIITPQEGRMQIMADRIFTISMPEKLPPDAQPKTSQSVERPGMLGTPVAPSQGGHGEVLPRSKFEDSLMQLLTIDDIKLKRYANAVLSPVQLSVKKASQELGDNELGLWADFMQEVCWGNIVEEIPELALTFLDTSRSNLKKVLNDTYELANQDEIISEIADLYWEAIAEQEYIAGKSQSVTDYQPPKSKDNQLRKFLNDAVSEINQSVQNGIVDAVIIGTTTYLTKSVDLVDKTLKINDNVISEINLQLMLLYARLVEDFGNKLAEYGE